MRQPMSARAASHTSASTFTSDTRLASMTFADTLASSAVCRSVRTTGTAVLDHWRRRPGGSPPPLAPATPTTSRSGRSESSTARPSRRNSGFHASRTSGRRRGPVEAVRAAAAVPTGTVELPTTTLP